jgi:hypothetical protein
VHTGPDLAVHLLPRAAGTLLGLGTGLGFEAAEDGRRSGAPRGASRRCAQRIATRTFRVPVTPQRASVHFGAVGCACASSETGSARAVDSFSSDAPEQRRVSGGCRRRLSSTVIAALITGIFSVADTVIGIAPSALPVPSVGGPSRST